MAQLYPLLFVIHETNINIENSLLLHNDPNYLGSYHAIIDRTGTIYYLVPAEAKAFAAAKSSFFNPITGEEEAINNSVDDFAFHVALESPPDGYNSTKKVHTGYTLQQYKSLAWLTRNTGVAQHRIVSHGQIKKPQSKEPRCFNTQVYQKFIEELTNKKNMDFGVLDIENG